MELGKLIEGYEDLNDPSCIEKILECEDELLIQAEEFMEILMDRLIGETITWHQPWYQQINSLSRKLENQSEEPFQTGTITKAENARIEKNWKKLVKKYNLPDKPECFARWRNKTKSRNPNTKEEQVRNYVTAFLARGLERNLYQIYRYAVSHFGAQNKGAYSDIEDKIMELTFLHEPEKAVRILTTVLGREPRGICKKLHVLYEGPVICKQKLKWKLPLATKFLNSLMTHSGLELNDLKNACIGISVWRKVGEDMDHPYPYLQRFWDLCLHTQLFVKCDVKLHRIRKKIIKRLMKSQYEVWRDIRWSEMKNQFPEGFTNRFLYSVVYYLVKNYPKNYKTEPLRDVLIFALKCLEELRQSKDKRLRTLKLNEDGSLEQVRYEEKFRLKI